MQSNESWIHEFWIVGIKHYDEYKNYDWDGEIVPLEITLSKEVKNRQAVKIFDKVLGTMAAEAKPLPIGCTFYAELSKPTKSGKPVDSIFAKIVNKPENWVNPLNQDDEHHFENYCHYENYDIDLAMLEHQQLEAAYGSGSYKDSNGAIFNDEGEWVGMD